MDSLTSALKSEASRLANVTTGYVPQSQKAPLIKISDALPTLLSFPDPTTHSIDLTPEELHTHLTPIRELAQSLKSPEWMTKLNGKPPISLFDPALNTIPYFYALVENIKAAQGTPGNQNDPSKIPSLHIPASAGFFASTCQALASADPRQLPYCGFQWRAVTEGIAVTALQNKEPGPAIDPVRTAILTLDPRSQVFTSLHLHFVTLCLRARSYRAALPIISKPLTAYPARLGSDAPSIPSHVLPDQPVAVTYENGLSHGLYARDVLAYHYACAQIHIALRSWAAALNSLNSILNHPSATQHVSTIAIEALKKWYLLSLLLPTPQHGDLPDRPAQSHIRHLRASTRAYAAISRAFLLADIRAFEAELLEGSDIWAYDRNQGLVRLAKRAFYRSRVRRLEDVFRALPISEVRSRALMPNDWSPVKTDGQTRAMVEDMIRSGELDATIAQSERGLIVTFNALLAPPSSLSSETQNTALLKAKMARLREQSAMMDRMEAALLTAPEFASHLRKKRAEKGRGKKSPGGGGGTGLPELLREFEEEGMEWQEGDDGGLRFGGGGMGDSGVLDEDLMVED